ncbi:MAG: DUF4105 domain-containing protein [Hydrogenophilaceae bacterium]|jgi:hypothetical protein|nr:DUF4105 domain-containing protein [Hydrogenophilaceae bacterium]
MAVIRYLLCLCAAMLVAGCATTARNDRTWLPYLAHTAQVARAPDGFAVTPVIDWSYNADGPTQQSRTIAAFAFRDLRNVWFVLEPQPGSNLAAHTFLLFEFAGDRLLGLTIEARREADEAYSVWRGLWNAYELSYVWASARDLLTRRAVYLRHETFVYPLALTDEQELTLLSRLLERTRRLEAEPRFYNTLFSNCTNELAKATSLPWHHSFVFTGASDDHLFRRGLIPGASFEDAHARADLTDFIRTLNDRPPAEFDAALLAELRRRQD